MFLIQLTPETLPQIIVTGAGPGIVHSNDFSLVISSKPARSGELLSVFCDRARPDSSGCGLGTAVSGTATPNGELTHRCDRERDCSRGTLRWRIPRLGGLIPSQFSPTAGSRGRHSKSPDLSSLNRRATSFAICPVTPESDQCLVQEVKK